MRKRTKLATMAMSVLCAFAANAAVVSTSTLAPTVDAEDEANLGANTGRLKWFADIEHDAGQTFTPSADLQLNSFTIQLYSGNENDGADEWVNLRLGTISRPDGVFTFTDIYEEEAHWDMDWYAGDYVTFTFDTPQTLTSGVEYGVITDAQSLGNWANGIPYINLLGGYDGGNAIGRGDARGDDLVFHADLTAGIPEPASLALLGLAGAFLVNRRRR